MPKMPLSELKALLDSERNDALAATRASKLSIERFDAMDYYLGDMAKDMPALEGRSCPIRRLSGGDDCRSREIVQIFTKPDDRILASFHVPTLPRSRLCCER
jgi:hypothetical protein